MEWKKKKYFFFCEFQVSSGLQLFKKQAADSPCRTEDMRSKQQPRPSFRWPQQRGDNVTGKYFTITIIE